MSRSARALEAQVRKIKRETVGDVDPAKIRAVVHAYLSGAIPDADDATCTIAERAARFIAEGRAQYDSRAVELGIQMGRTVRAMEALEGILPGAEGED